MRKNKILLSIVFIMVSTVTFSQFVMTTPTKQKQKKSEIKNLQINAGFGFSNLGTPIFVGLDYGVTNEITVGGEISYRVISLHDIDYFVAGFFGNVNYHFNKILKLPPKFNAYGGVSLGYYDWSSDIDNNLDNIEHSSGISLYGQVGGRYFFNKKFGLNLEIGVGSISGGKLGITYVF